MFISFSTFFIFLAIFPVLECLCLIFHTIQISCHNPGSTVCISHISRFSLFLAIFQVLPCVFLFLHVFQCFSPYFMSYPVSFSFPRCQFSHHIPGATVSNFHFLRFTVFLAIFQVIPFLCLIFHVFQFSYPKSRYYSLYFSVFHVFHFFSLYSRS